MNLAALASGVSTIFRNYNPAKGFSRKHRQNLMSRNNSPNIRDSLKPFIRHNGTAYVYPQIKKQDRAIADGMAGRRPTVAG